MTDSESLDLFEGGDLPALLAAVPLGAAPHVRAEVLWALASPDCAIPSPERGVLITHVCSCRECFGLLAGYRRSQSVPIEEIPAPPAVDTADVWQRWNALRVAFFIGVSAAGLRLRPRPFRMRMRMRDVGPIGPEIVLQPGDAHPVDMADLKAILRISAVNVVERKFAFSVELDSYSPDLDPEKIRLEIHRESGDVRPAQTFTNGKIQVEELAVSNCELLVIDSREDRLIGSIVFEPAGT